METRARRTRLDLSSPDSETVAMFFNRQYQGCQPRQTCDSGFESLHSAMPSLSRSQTELPLFIQSIKVVIVIDSNMFWGVVKLSSGG